MLYIWGIYVEPSLSLSQALTEVYGLGKFRADLVAKYLGVNPAASCHCLKSFHQIKLQHMMKTRHWKTGGLLRQQRFEELGKLKEIRCYRGQRHTQSLPVRGQRTHANARTMKNRKPRT